MPASETRVIKRTTEVLNLCDAGTYSATLSTRNKTRNEDAIEDFVIEAGLDLLRAIGETPNEFRHNLVTIVTPAHMSFLPDHVGDPVFVEIQKFDGADWQPADRRDYRKVDSYRFSPDNIYDDVPHDEEGSSLGGLYDIWERRFYFTGFAARVGLVQIARADTATKIPEILEPIWVRLAIGNSDKVGAGQYSQSIAGSYGARGMQDLQEFKGGRRSFPEVSDPEPSSAVHG